MPIRYYQREAVDSIFDYWKEADGNPLVDMATGVGKSITLGTLFEELIRDYPDLRLLNVVHVIELVLGNYAEFLGLCPFAPAGVAAAGANRRDYKAQVLFGQIQSIYNKAAEIGHVDVLAIDEVHLVPNKENAIYRQFIDALRTINPDLKIVGLSATVYRLDSGRLDEGDDKLFDRVVYTYSIRQGVDDGYLTPLSSKPLSTNYDVAGVSKSMGDYKFSDYREAVDTDDLNKRVVQEVLDVEGTRRKSLIFTRGVEHAKRMRDAFQLAGRAVEVVHGGTPAGERRKLIEALKSGELWGLVNDNVLSTGTNIVGVDLIVDCYRTMSAARYVQRAGRGTRVVYPPGFDPESVDAEARRAAIAGHIKPNCRYMDFAGNIKEHGPVDMIQPRKPGKGQGEAPIKVCPSCFEINHASVRRCSCCGHEFDIEEKPRFEARSDTAPILSVTSAEWLPVRSRKFRYHEKLGGLPSVRVEFASGLTTYKTWLCPQHTGFAKSKADRWWRQHGGQTPFPSSVDEWLSRESELVATAEFAIKPKPRSKYFDVTDFRPANDNVPSASNDNRPAAEILEDSIPF
ncbi:DEAD/DEAH box helicase family protein [Bosea sp. FBZP-16]|uniref:DEAD/DEAH box helicase n=1 Tax=Bosea sp. FBZP-16 TaxID=2065382 RepID=UPI000C3004C7|nr:DEAD/DEAH box helicase family protein [Bosea sp. FBZP-16]